MWCAWRHCSNPAGWSNPVTSRLAAALAFSAFVGKIKLEVVSLERFVELEE
jgi:hypothetical protein